MTKQDIGHLNSHDPLLSQRYHYVVAILECHVRRTRRNDLRHHGGPFARSIAFAVNVITMGNRHSTEQVERHYCCHVYTTDEYRQDRFGWLTINHFCFFAEDIVRDFQNKAVQDQWNVFRASVLGRRHDRHALLLQAAQQAEAQQASRAAQANERMKRLDDAIETMNAKFSDQVVAASYDADHYISQYASDAPASSKDVAVSPCLGPRAHWMFCAQKYVNDTRPCDAYLAVLERCVQDAIIQKPQT